MTPRFPAAGPVKVTSRRRAPRPRKLTRIPLSAYLRALWHLALIIVGLWVLIPCLIAIVQRHL